MQSARWTSRRSRSGPAKDLSQYAAIDSGSAHSGVSAAGRSRIARRRMASSGSLFRPASFISSSRFLSLGTNRSRKIAVRLVASFDVRERARQVELKIARRKIITQPNLVLAQVVAVAQRPLDLALKMIARAGQPARDGGLMLVHQAANLPQREIVPVVVRHPHPIPRRERLERAVERPAEHRHVAGAVGAGCVGVLDPLVGKLMFGMVVERLETALGADIIHVTLCQNGAHPGQKRA